MFSYISQLFDNCMKIMIDDNEKEDIETHRIHIVRKRANPIKSIHKKSISWGENIYYKININK